MLITKAIILTYYSYPVVFNLGSEKKKNSNTSGNIYQKLKLSNVLTHLNLDMNYFTEDIFTLYKWQYNLKEDMTLFSFLSYFEDCTSVQNHTPTILLLLL